MSLCLYTFTPFLLPLQPYIYKVMMEKTAVSQEKAILIGISFPGQDDSLTQEYLDELEFLAYTAGAEVAARFSQNLQTANPRTFVGTGKAEEIAAYIKENEIDIAVFDDELTPSQLKNIEKDIRVQDPRPY